MKEINVAPIVSDFILCDNFVSLIIGPIGSGKTLGSILRWEKLIYEQEPSEDGIRYSRMVVVRNTAVELRDTTIKSFEDHFGNQLKFNWGNLTAIYEHDDVKAEILFRALDKPGDMKKLLSLEITFAYLNELRELPKEAIENVTSRLGRYPSPKRGAEATNPCAWADTNAFDNETWIYKKFIENKPYNHTVFEQPPAILNAVFQNNQLISADINPDAENLENLPKEYYRGFIAGKSEDWVRVMIMRQYIPLKTGKPVYPEYNDFLHCINEDKIGQPNPKLPLICAGDNGRWSGFLIGQVDTLGRLVVFDEITSDDINLTVFSEIIASHMKAHYAGFEFETWIDPWAANQRGQVTDDTMAKVYRKSELHPRVSNTGSPTTMVEAVKKKLGEIRVGQPAIIISSKCKQLRKGLNGSYQYKRINVSGEKYTEKPDKGPYSHICNAFEFLLDGTGASRELLSSNQFKNHKGPIRVKSNYDPLGG
jgi:hypothetical protein